MSSPTKILLVQLFSNGDCLFATTVAKQIKEDYPGSHLTWAIASFCKPIIANNPFVDEITEVTSVPKNDVAAFRRFKKEIAERKERGEFDEVFITHNMDTNQALYDGIIRSGILNAYPHSITVPLKPVLNLYEAEIIKARQFAEKNDLARYDQVILFEFAPQSGQSKKITKAFAISIAEKLAANDRVAVILSSGHKIDHQNKGIIDGSELTIRETAALTHYCTLLLGCSSGITWISTSDAAKQLPMIQLLNPDTTWINPISRDFKRFGINADQVIEMIDFDEEKVISCVNESFIDFHEAKRKYNQDVPIHFKSTRKIVYNLLCYLELGAISKHIKVNRKVYGNNSAFYKEVFLGIALSPFKLARNIFRKK
jgi:ADP-heptose:LPS heptosyltransferase